MPSQYSPGEGENLEYLTTNMWYQNFNPSPVWFRVQIANRRPKQLGHVEPFNCKFIMSMYVNLYLKLSGVGIFWTLQVSQSWNLELWRFRNFRVIKHFRGFRNFRDITESRFSGTLKFRDPVMPKITKKCCSAPRNQISIPKCSRNPSTATVQLSNFWGLRNPKQEQDKTKCIIGKRQDDKFLTIPEERINEELSDFDSNTFIYYAGQTGIQLVSENSYIWHKYSNELSNIIILFVQIKIWSLDIMCLSRMKYYTLANCIFMLCYNTISLTM